MCRERQWTFYFVSLHHFLYKLKLVWLHGNIRRSSFNTNKKNFPTYQRLFHLRYCRCKHIWPMVWTCPGQSLISERGKLISLSRRQHTLCFLSYACITARGFRVIFWHLLFFYNGFIQEACSDRSCSPPAPWLRIPGNVRFWPKSCGVFSVCVVFEGVYVVSREYIFFCCVQMQSALVKHIKYWSD